MTDYDFKLKTNKAICVFPFTHSASTTLGKQVLCCNDDQGRLEYESSAEMNQKTVDEYWNNEEMVNVRLSMLAGEKIPRCQRCYQDEADGIRSYRQTLRDADGRVVHWDEENECDIDRDEIDLKLFFERLSEEELRTGVLTEKNYPVYFDYRTMHCNLSCQTCAPGASTSYHKKLRGAIEETAKNKHPRLTNAAEVPLAKYDSNFPDRQEAIAFEMKQADDIIRAIDNRTLTEIYWAGGEPMMSPMHWKVMDTLYDLLETDPEYVNSVQITYNTNLTRTKWKGNSVYKKLGKFKGISIVASIDGVGNTYNYIRSGANWSTIVENIEEHRNARSNDLIDSWTGNQLDVQLVLTNLWILHGTQYLDFFEKICGTDVCFRSLRLLYFMNDGKGNTGLANTPATLAPLWLPKKIMLPAIDKVLEHSLCKQGVFKTYELECIRDSIEKDNNHFSITHAPHIKKHVLWWDSLRNDGLTFGSVLREINTDAWLWYNSVNANTSSHQLKANGERLHHKHIR